MMGMKERKKERTIKVNQWLIADSRQPKAYSMRQLIFFLLTLAMVPGAYAQSAGAFSRVGFGARGIAMGGALVADAFGDTSPYYNPSLAPFTAQQNISASAAFMTLDRELQYLQFATPLKPRAGLAAGLIHAGVSNIDGRDNSGYHTADYSTDEFALFLAFGVQASQRVALGLGFTFFRADYFEGLTPVNSIGLDLGFNVRVTEHLRVGFTLDDLLARYEWDTSSIYGDDGRTTTDYFPSRIRVGAAYQLMNGQTRITAEYESRASRREVRTRDVVLSGDLPRQVELTDDLTLQENRLRFGAEYRPMDVFAVRAGLDGVGVTGGLRPSAGFMVEQGLGELVVRGAYTFVLEPYALGTMHLITLRVLL